MGTLKNYINKTTKAAPLAVFRVCFGVMMFASIVRFWANGWIKKLYLDPSFHFTYYGFEWVKPLGNATYLLFILCGLSAIFIALGFKYRIAIITFFISFTYIELMDKTSYLNHYYFISCVSFLLIFSPANAMFSVDAVLNPRIKNNYVPRFTIDTIKLMLGIVYFYAGLAKLNSDWLIEAMPLKIWLATKTHIPILGQFLEQDWLAYAFSWSGAIYDLFIPFLLLNKRTRPLAFVAVVIFHVLTRILFPIGMFPFIMIVGALIFFDAEFHERLLSFFQTKVQSLKFKEAFRAETRAEKREKSRGKTINNQQQTTNTNNSELKTQNSKLIILTIFFAIQLLLPWRYLAYPGELFWTEEGFRFSWRVMLMEKAGYAQFKVVDNQTKKEFRVNNTEFLTAFQEKQMSFQPDFILEYAHFLHQYYEKEGVNNPEIYVESYVALNGRLSQPYINPTINLANEKESFKHKTWILPFNDKIYGL